LGCAKLAAGRLAIEELRSRNVSAKNLAVGLTACALFFEFSSVKAPLHR
jgi:hypothetical protein